jgi:hypothetical membrane protein
MDTTAPNTAADATAVDTAHPTPDHASDRWNCSRLAVWAGIVVPVGFIATFTLDGALTPGYSAMVEPISFLEVGPHGWIQILNFVVLGLATIALAVTYAASMRPVLPARCRRPMAGLLALCGAGYLTAALFPPAAFDQPQAGLSPALHTLGFEMVFFGVGLAAVTLGWSLVRTPGWRGDGIYSLITGIVLLVVPIGNLYAILAPAGQAVFSNPGQAPSLGGLFNRIVLVIAFAWYVVLAAQMRRIGDNSSIPAVARLARESGPALIASPAPSSVTSPPSP